MTNCSECLELSFDRCSDFIFELGLSDGTYWAWVYDKFNNIYKKEVAVASNSFTLYITDFPEGLFFSSGFTLNISTSETNNSEEDFTFGYDSYSCVVFDTYDSIGTGSSMRPEVEGRRIRITSADFIGNDYQNNYLIGLIAETDFDVYSAGGTGGLLNEGTAPTDGYTFNSATGTITTTADSYLIIIY